MSGGRSSVYVTIVGIAGSSPRFKDAFNTASPGGSQAESDGHGDARSTPSLAAPPRATHTAAGEAQIPSCGRLPRIALADAAGRWVVAKASGAPCGEDEAQRGWRSGEGLDAIGHVVRRAVHLYADWGSHHLARRVWPQERLETLRLADPEIKPKIVLVCCQDHGHSDMQRPDEVVRNRRDDRTGIHGLTVRRHPAFPQPGEGEGPPVAQADVEGLLVPALLLPFIEAIREEEAPSLLEGPAECRLGRHRLRTSIDHPGADGWPLRPQGDETPAEETSLTFRGIMHLQDGKDCLRWSDVVAGSAGREIGQVKLGGKVCRRYAEGETTAHAFMLLP